MTSGPLPQHEFEAIYAKVPRLTVEIVLTGPRGVFLTQRTAGACAGLWHLPGGTVRYGERLVDAVARVGADELATILDVGVLLGAIEYPSHLALGIDWPIGLAFSCRSALGEPSESATAQWFTELPSQIHDEQRVFLRHQQLAS